MGGFPTLLFFYKLTTGYKVRQSVITMIFSRYLRDAGDYFNMLWDWLQRWWHTGMLRM